MLALVANTFAREQKEMEIGARYVELATEILRAEPKPETIALRTWAISVIGHYSRVPLSREAKDELESQRIEFMLKSLRH